MTELYLRYNLLYRPDQTSLIEDRVHRYVLSTSTPSLLQERAHLISGLFSMADDEEKARKVAAAKKRVSITRAILCVNWAGDAANGQ